MGFFTYKQKKVYYSTEGSGSPLIIIHGNSVSSKMHKALIHELKADFQVISIDLPGHGESERLSEWPIDYWFEHAKVIVELIKTLNIEKADLLGYSGGALIAINTALEYPHLVSKVIADSFEGETSDKNFADNIFKDRDNGKKDPDTAGFWEAMHGSDWETVIDKDTSVIYHHHQKVQKFFHKEFEDISVPVLLTGSEKDEYIQDIKSRYQSLAEKSELTEIEVFKTGSHPACLTSGMKYINTVKKFLEK